MPYTTKADNDVITASFWNANVRDQVISTVTSGSRPSGTEGQFIWETDTDRLLVFDGAQWIPVSGRIGGRWARVATQNVNTATNTNISWDTEVADSSNIFAPTGTIITIPAGLGGVWSIATRIAWSGDPGAGYLQIATSATGTYNFDVGNSLSLGASGSVVIPMAAADTFVVNLYQTSGSTRTITGAVDMFRWSA